MAAATPENLETRFKRYEALVKVTSDKRFTEDSSADTQDALSEKRKERDDLRTALVKDLEKAFLGGTLFYGGQEQDLDGVTDFKDPVQTALSAVIPDIYASFGVGDRTCDFARRLKALLNPATSTLHTVAPELDLFDTQGSLQQQSALVAQVLEVISDLEDEDVDPAGAILLEAPDRKGFRGFERPPFGWSTELVRLVLAACFRAGAIYVERPTPSGPAPLYCGSSSHVVAETLTHLEARLDPGKFLRVHRSTIVNSGRIAAVHAMIGGAYEVELKGGVRIRTGRQYRDQIRKLLGAGERIPSLLPGIADDGRGVPA